MGNPCKSYAALDLGLQDVSNIAIAVKTLLINKVPCEFDKPANFENMGVFYFTFPSGDDMRKAILLFGGLIDLQREPEWPDDPSECYALSRDLKTIDEIPEH